MNSFMRSVTHSILPLSAAAMLMCVGCTSASSPKHQDFVVPSAADQIARTSKKKIRNARKNVFEQRYKGVFDNLKVSLFSVECLNGERAEDNVYPLVEQWCIYHTLRPPKCMATLNDAMREVCREIETQTTHRRSADRGGTRNPSSF